MKDANRKIKVVSLITLVLYLWQHHRVAAFSLSAFPSIAIHYFLARDHHSISLIPDHLFLAHFSNLLTHSLGFLNIVGDLTV